MASHNDSFEITIDNNLILLNLAKSNNTEGCGCGGNCC